MPVLTRALNLSLTKTGIFADEALYQFLIRRNDSSVDRLRQVEGHTYHFQREQTKAVCGKRMAEYFDLIYDMKPEHQDELDSQWGEIMAAMMKQSIEQLQRASKPIERSYSVLTCAIWIEFVWYGSPEARKVFLKGTGFTSLDDAFARTGGLRAVAAALDDYEYFSFVAEAEGLLIDPFLSGAFEMCCLRHGETQLLHKFLDARAAVQAALEKRKRNGDSFQVHSLDKWYFWAFCGRTCMRSGLAGLARSCATDVLKLERWSDVTAFLNETWPVLDGLFGRMGVGTKEYNVECFKLDMYLLGHADAPSAEIAHIVSDNPEQVIKRDRETYINRNWCTGYSLAEASALVCEQLGLDVLAERYAKYVLKQHHKVVLRASMRLLLGRLERKAGRQQAAISQFEAAASEAFDFESPYIGLRAGRECGGQQGRLIIEKAAHAIGRSADELIADYDRSASLSALRNIPSTKSSKSHGSMRGGVAEGEERHLPLRQEMAVADQSEQLNLGRLHSGRL